MISEHEKLLDFLKEFSLIDLEKKGEKELNNFINDKNLEIENFRFNQPISFANNNELYFCRNMEIYIFLNQELISSIIDNNKNKFSFDKTSINKALVNGAIVAIHSHELNHNFHKYYYCSKNGSEL